MLKDITKLLAQPITIRDFADHTTSILKLASIIDSVKTIKEEVNNLKTISLKVRSFPGITLIPGIKSLLKSIDLIADLFEYITLDQ
jgi:hypothetical protein